MIVKLPETFFFTENWKLVTWKQTKNQNFERKTWNFSPENPKISEFSQISTLKSRNVDKISE